MGGVGEAGVETSGGSKGAYAVGHAESCAVKVEEDRVVWVCVGVKS